MTMRPLLSQDPVSFNELLDLFEGYVSTIGPPIHKGHDMLREVVGAGENPALGHIFGVACDAEDMAKRLKQIRAARNTGTDVTITMTRSDVDRLEYALREIDLTFSYAAAVFDLLHGRASADDANADSHAMAVMFMANRALTGADEREGAIVRGFLRRLTEAGKYQQFDQEEAA